VGWLDGDTQLGLFAVIDAQSFQKKGTGTATATTIDGLEDQEALETSTVIG
jgi:hypothetical protein